MKKGVIHAVLITASLGVVGWRAWTEFGPGNDRPPSPDVDPLAVFSSLMDPAGQPVEEAPTESHAESVAGFGSMKSNPWNAYALGKLDPSWRRRVAQQALLDSDGSPLQLRPLFPPREAELEPDRPDGSSATERAVTDSATAQSSAEVQGPDFSVTATLVGSKSSFAVVDRRVQRVGDTMTDDEGREYVLVEVRRRSILVERNEQRFTLEVEQQESRSSSAPSDSDPADPGPAQDPAALELPIMELPPVKGEG